MECENFHMLSSDPYTQTYKINKCKKIRSSLQVLGGGSNCEEVREEMCPVWKVLVRFGTKNEVCTVKDEESLLSCYCLNLVAIPGMEMETNYRLLLYKFSVVLF